MQRTEDEVPYYLKRLMGDIDLQSIKTVLELNCVNTEKGFSLLNCPINIICLGWDVQNGTEKNLKHIVYEKMRVET